MLPHTGLQATLPSNLEHDSDAIVIVAGITKVDAEPILSEAL